MSDKYRFRIYRLFFIAITALVISSCAMLTMPTALADDMVSPSTNDSTGGYLDIEFIIELDVVNSLDALYVTVKVIEDEWAVEGAVVSLTSTNPDNVTITTINNVTDMDGLANFVMVGEVNTETTILLNAMGTYNGHEAALDSKKVIIVPEVKPIITREVYYIGAGAIMLFTVGAIATEVGKYGAFKLIIFPLYSRMKKEEVLDHFVRGQIYGHIIAHPGSHYNAIKQELKVTNGTLSHHLKTLEIQGFVKSHRDGTYKRFYPVGTKLSKDKGIRLSDLQISIIDTIRQSEGITQAEIASAIGMSQQSVSYNLNILIRKDIIRYERSGVRKHYYIIDG